MAKTKELEGFFKLTPQGEVIFSALLTHVREKLKLMDVDVYELSMLANSFALFAECAEYCNENGIKMEFVNDKGGKYEQICPEYTVMKNEYQNVLKHSAKFGLNPGDREKIFKGIKPAEKEPDFDE